MFTKKMTLVNSMNELNKTNDKTENLALENIEIENLLPLSRFKNLERIAFRHGCIIDNLEGIEQMSNLIELDVNNAELREAKSSINKHNLKYLCLDYNKLKELTGISNNLVQISANGNEIKNIAELLNCGHKLEYIALGENSISSISGIKNAIEAAEVILCHNNIKDIAELEYLKKIEILDVSSNDISNIESLNGLKELKELKVSDNKNIKSLEVVYGMSKLKILSASELKNVKAIDISKMPFLTRINLMKCNIADISSFAEAKALGYVNLCYNKVKDLSPLLALPNLHTVWLTGNNGLGLRDKTPVINKLIEKGVRVNTSY